MPQQRALGATREEEGQAQVPEVEPERLSDSAGMQAGADVGAGRRVVLGRGGGGGPRLWPRCVLQEAPPRCPFGWVGSGQVGSGQVGSWQVGSWQVGTGQVGSGRHPGF